MSSGERKQASGGEQPREGDGQGRGKQRKPYEPPKTVELGSVTKLTAGGSGGTPEGMSGMTGHP